MKTTALQLIADERARQEAKGFDATHDDYYTNGELLDAAHCYAQAVQIDSRCIPADWPFDLEWWKPTGDKVRDLTKAAAMLAAEIDRLLRARKYMILYPPGEDNATIAEQMLELIDKVGPEPVMAMLSKIPPPGQWSLRSNW